MTAPDLSPEEALKVRAFGFDLPVAADQTGWPESEEETTADAMILHAVRVAAIADAEGERWMRYADVAGHGTAEFSRRNGRWIDFVETVIANSQVATLLVEVQKHDPARADELARLIWDITEDGGVFLELGWEWAQNRGVDAEQLYGWADKVAGASFAHSTGESDQVADALGQPGGALEVVETPREVEYGQAIWIDDDEFEVRKSFGSEPRALDEGHFLVVRELGAWFMVGDSDG